MKFYSMAGPGCCSTKYCQGSQERAVPRGLPFSTHLGGGGLSSLLYISIAYYMQKGGGWVQITCKIAYILNGRSHIYI